MSRILVYYKLFEKLLDRDLPATTASGIIHKCLVFVVSLRSSLSRMASDKEGYQVYIYINIDTLIDEFWLLMLLGKFLCWCPVLC